MLVKKAYRKKVQLDHVLVVQAKTSNKDMDTKATKVGKTQLGKQKKDSEMTSYIF